MYIYDVLNAFIVFYCRTPLRETVPNSLLC